MAEGRMNLAALQQRDPYITEILDTASQVALYSFNAKSNEWEKTSIEGSLFIYERTAAPLKGFMILNRLGLNNLIEPITKDLEFQQQPPFLLYRNAKSIYGVWFYDKEECKRLGQKLNSYVQAIHDEMRRKQTSPAVVGASAEVSKKLSAPGATSQVDIMQMLSKAQQEYDTGSKKSEPKPMIDNPNASATKTSSGLIRPRPLKMPDSEQNEAEDCDPVTPGTGVISLDALFRTASLQQGTSSQKQPGTGQPQKHSEGFFSDQRMHRSISMTSTTSTLVGADNTAGDDTDSLPPLLKHIMSTGSMVEEIERQQQGVGRVGPTGKPGLALLGPSGDYAPRDSLVPSLPDLSQPPPNHPAYRGTSPQAPPNPSKKSPTSVQGQQIRSEMSKSRSSPPDVTSNPGVPDVAPHILSSNLLPVFSSLANTSQPSTTTSKALSSSLVTHPVRGVSSSAVRPNMNPRGDADMSYRDTVDPSPVLKSAPLLTPGELLNSSSSSLASSTLAAFLTTTTYSTSVSQENYPLSLAAASLTTELLSPMAFLSSTQKASPVTVRQGASVDSQYRSKDSDILPVAALTKEQLQQALLYLLKNDSSFITTIHEAYLKSLRELSGGKT
ncbi:mRNA-decapping enzyme 1B-like isoform X2 [Dreissena polymorpha]|uniref:mRNA-decapping enzyme 1B-like isoform X2 n=1 Tax=Dreissena polymorpha TaxID=45954 RepID=UPI002264F322|nr:mRNA-decapping enzyme 1B-like isoform X2 [Dreissena polymorpha]